MKVEGYFVPSSLVFWDGVIPPFPEALKRPHRQQLRQSGSGRRSVLNVKGRRGRGAPGTSLSRREGYCL